jgi:alpha-tubulin suppressor-like RCC1 family protein
VPTPARRRTARSGVTNATAVSAGGSHSCALTSSGDVKCWGLNQEGELGINDATVNNATTPRNVDGLSSGQSEISAGIQHSCSRTSTTIRCWGIYTDWQLGNGTTARSFTPVIVTGF